MNFNSGYYKKIRSFSLGSKVKALDAVEMDAIVPAKQGSNAKDPQGCCWRYTIREAPFSIMTDIESVKYQVEGDFALEGNAVTEGFIHFKKKKRYAALRKMHATGEFKIAVGTPYINYEMCSATGHFANTNANGQPATIREIGERPRAPKNEKKKKEVPLIQGPDGKELNVWAYALHPDITYAEADAVLVEYEPEKMLTKGSSIRNELMRRKEPKYECLYSLEDFNRPPIEFEDDKVVLLWGESDTGKSSYARAHFKCPLEIGGSDDFKKFDPQKHDGLFFDDVSFLSRNFIHGQGRVPDNVVIHLLDRLSNHSIAARYCSAIIPCKIPRIFTYNDANPFYDPATTSPEQVKAIERRIQRIHITSPLYNVRGTKTSNVKPMDLDEEINFDEEQIPELNNNNLEVSRKRNRDEDDEEPETIMGTLKGNLQKKQKI